mmetsp:Transcript_960/g.2263  ORF Transcript_960/g.2263 Transcript_960/m.2263 type:complete len:313 (+) Transcript_960:639-1577(+)
MLVNPLVLDTAHLNLVRVNTNNSACKCANRVRHCTNCRSDDEHLKARCVPRLHGEHGLHSSKRKECEARKHTCNHKQGMIRHVREGKGKDAVSKEREESKKDEGAEGNEAFEPRVFVAGRDLETQFLNHHHVNKEVAVVSHEVNYQLSVRLGHTTHLVKLHHLLLLALWVVVELPVLALAFLQNKFELCTRRKGVTKTHRQSISELGAPTENEDSLHAERATGGTRDNGKGRQNAVEAAENHALNEVALALVAILVVLSLGGRSSLVSLARKIGIMAGIGVASQGEIAVRTSGAIAAHKRRLLRGHGEGHAR